jgi:hypothetical protein
MAINAAYARSVWSAAAPRAVHLLFVLTACRSFFVVTKAPASWAHSIRFASFSNLVILVFFLQNFYQ